MATLGDRERALALLVDGPLPPLIEAAVCVGATPVETRIVLTIDPTVSPVEVMNAYRRARADVLPSRFRGQTAKHTRLAAFAVERPDCASWAALLDAWNREVRAEHPEWLYSNTDNFARDCRAARLKLLNPPVR